MLECVVNISEGRDLPAVERIAAEAAPALLDLHTDPHHHRSVLTVVGEEAARAVAEAAVRALDLGPHIGVHPRLGVVDVVPFVALEGSATSEARAARDDFARWLGATLAVPCFLYGPERTLPELRREAFRSLHPNTGPPGPHPTAGATAVGHRPVLVAYNVRVAGTDLATVRRIAASVRTPEVRALGLSVGDRFQVSMNLITPSAVGPAAAFDRVAEMAERYGVSVVGAELVGLLPERVLRAVPEHRWAELDIGAERTIEARLEATGLR